MVNESARRKLEALVGLDRVLVINTDNEHVGLVGWRRAFTGLSIFVRSFK